MKISEQALVQRINRRLDSEQLHRTRGQRWKSDLGDYFVTDQNNVITAQHVDIQTLADELGIVARC